MKCRKQPPFLEGKPTLIEDLWEVRLVAKTWQRLSQIAKRRHVSFSMIARYCVFRLAEQKNLKLTHRLLEIHHKNRMQLSGRPELHRHLVCLYGEDVLLLRLAAMRLGITISALIRLALALYLPSLAMENLSNATQVTEYELFVLGIKRWLRIEPTELHAHSVPVIQQFTFSMFLPWQWWS